MGKHYVPQEYLRGFGVPTEPNCIWQFDKQNRRFSDEPVSIKKVAQQRDYYPPAIEEQITRRVEIPGNAVLAKLRSGHFDLTDEERFYFAIYIATMLHRVPVHRERGHRVAPAALASVVQEIREAILAEEAAGRLSTRSAEKRLQEVNATEAKFSATPPQQMIDQIENPFPSENICKLIFAMNWRFLIAESRQRLLTSDNPAFFFEHFGLGNTDSELTFPISSDVALFGSWKPMQGSRSVVRDPRFVKEANRRVASGASRFVYYHAKEDWLAVVASKETAYLSRINW
jgi:hypothetical protein